MSRCALPWEPWVEMRSRSYCVACLGNSYCVWLQEEIQHLPTPTTDIFLLKKLSIVDLLPPIFFSSHLPHSGTEIYIKKKFGCCSQWFCALLMLSLPLFMQVNVLQAFNHTWRKHWLVRVSQGETVADVMLLVVYCFFSKCNCLDR